MSTIHISSIEVKIYRKTEEIVSDVSLSEHHLENGYAEAKNLCKIGGLANSLCLAFLMFSKETLTVLYLLLCAFCCHIGCTRAVAVPKKIHTAVDRM